MNITRKRLDKIKKTKNQSKRRIHYKNKKGNNNKKLHKKKRKHSKNYKKYKKTQKQKKAYNLKNKSFRIKAKLKQLRKKKIKPIRQRGGSPTSKNPFTILKNPFKKKRTTKPEPSLTTIVPAKMEETRTDDQSPAADKRLQLQKLQLQKELIKTKGQGQGQGRITQKMQLMSERLADDNRRIEGIIRLVLKELINSEDLSLKTKEKLQNLGDNASESGSPTDGSKNQRSPAYLKNLWQKTKERFKSKFKKKKSETIEYTDPEERKNIVKNLTDKEDKDFRPLFEAFNDYVAKKEDGIFKEYNETKNIESISTKIVAQYTFLMNNQTEIIKAIKTNAKNDDDFTVDKFDKMFETTRFKFAPYPQKDIHAPQKAQIMVVNANDDLATMSTENQGPNTNIVMNSFKLKHQIKEAQKETGQVSEEEKSEEEEGNQGENEELLAVCDGKDKLDGKCVIARSNKSDTKAQGLYSALYAILFSNLWKFDQYGYNKYMKTDKSAKDLSVLEKLYKLARNKTANEWNDKNIYEIHNEITKTKITVEKEESKNEDEETNDNFVFKFVKNLIKYLKAIKYPIDSSDREGQVKITSDIYEEGEEGEEGGIHGDLVDIEGQHIIKAIIKGDPKTPQNYSSFVIKKYKPASVTYEQAPIDDPDVTKVKFDLKEEPSQKTTIHTGKIDTKNSFIIRIYEKQVA